MHRCFVSNLAVLECNRLAHRLSLVPTCRGYLRCEKDAVWVLESCLRGELFHLCRGPRDGEAVISGNIFVWEPNSTGIDHWRDGVEWASQEVGGFEGGEAIDGSGLMKKTNSIRASRTVHHVVCYYTAGDKIWKRGVHVLISFRTRDEGYLWVCFTCTDT